MTIISTTWDYHDGDDSLQGFIAFDDTLTTPRPAVMINHAWGGRDEFVADKAVKLAQSGYLGFAVDMYGQGKRGSSREENAQLMQPFIDDRHYLRRRMLAARAAIKDIPQADDDKIAAIGFCFGGLCVVELARSGADIAGIVSFHGLLAPAATMRAQSVKAKMLILHGHDDPMVPVEHVVDLQQELSAAGADWQIHTFGHTMHAFTNPVANDPAFGTVYEPHADQRSWRLMLDFLQEIFA